MVGLSLLDTLTSESPCPHPELRWFKECEHINELPLNPSMWCTIYSRKKTIGLGLIPRNQIHACRCLAAIMSSCICCSRCACRPTSDRADSVALLSPCAAVSSTSTSSNATYSKRNKDQGKFLIIGGVYCGSRA